MKAKFHQNVAPIGGNTVTEEQDLADDRIPVTMEVVGYGERTS